MLGRLDESPRWRVLPWAVGLLAAVVLALLAATFALLNGDTAKAAIERRLATLTGSDIRYRTLALRVWPRPAADLQDVTLRLGSNVEVAASRVELRFAFLPLLRGDARVSLMRLERPALVARIPARGEAPVPDDLLAAYRGLLGPVTEWLVLHAQGAALEVRDGSVELASSAFPIVRLDSLVVDGDVSSDSIEATMAARANLWRGARVRWRIGTASLAADVEVDIEGLDAASLVARGLAGSTVGIVPAAAAVALKATTDGRQAATGELRVDVPTVGVTRNGSRLDVGASRLRLRARYAPTEASFVVDELALGDLLPAATGSLIVRPGAGAIVLDAASPRVDAGRIRAAALALAGDAALVRAVAAIVQGGNALDLRVHAVGDTGKVLSDPFAYELSMGVEAASIEVPALSLRLSGASGNVRIAQRVLSARGVAATIGRSSLRNGDLVLALDPTVALRELSAALDVDLAESRGFAVRVLGGPDARQEWNRIESIEGRAKGTLALREVRGGFRQTYDVTSLTAKIRHADVPFPVAIDTGGLHYESGGALALRGVAGAIGGSRIERLDAELGLSPELVVRSAAGTAVLALDELYPWFAQLAVARPLRGEVSALHGTVGVTLAQLAGPLYAPGRLDVAAVLVPQQVRVDSPHLPGTLGIAAGTIRLDGADLGFDGVRLALLDARGTLSGALRAYASPARRLDASVARATMGPRSLEWAEDAAGWAPGARVRAPITIERARIRWPAAGPWRLEIDAAAALPSGARSEVEFGWSPGSVQMRRFTFKDEDSDARVTLDWQPERAGLTFQGFVSGRSFERILVVPPGASGALRGEFAASIDRVDPIRSRATGKLEGADIVLLAAFDLPLALDRIAIEADGDRVSVRDTALRLAGDRLTLAGSVARAGDGFEVDADIDVDGVDAEQLFAQVRPRGSTTAAGSPWGWPLRGRVGLRAGHVDVLGYRLEPLVATLALGGRKVTASVTEARLCGIPVPFTVSATPDAVEVAGRATAQGLALAGAAACLTKDALRASGTADFSADFTAGGAPAALLASARGSARLRARDGRIADSRAVSGVLSLDKVREGMVDAEFDVARDGLPYVAIEVDASLADGRVTIDRGLLESLPLNVAVRGDIRLADRQVALTGVALPIVNAIARRVPLLGGMVRDPVVGVPFSVSGDLRDPQVTRVGATAIAGALVQTLQSVVWLPVQLLGGGAGEAEAPQGDRP